MLRVKSGICSALSLPNTQIVFIGRHKCVKKVEWTEKLSAKLNGVEQNAFESALKRLTPGSSVPVWLDLVKISSVADEVSRGNVPANSHAIFRELKGLKPVSGVKDVSIVLFSEYSHVMASVAAIARCFPIFTRKTQFQQFENIQIEVVTTDEKSLSDEDLSFLTSLSGNIRKCAMQVDMPGRDFNTEAFLQDALDFVRGISPNIATVIIKINLLKQGFGGIYNVGKASRHPPVFVSFTHDPPGASKSYALVGKGITFDTGGLQIKGKTAMPSMKIDHGGASALLSAFGTLIEAGFNQTLHCLLCIAENHISPDATKPDDVITLLSGKSVEISNTDAEGRLVLADGVWYAKNKLKAQTIIDMATLTGAQSYASGKLHSSILTNSEELEKQTIIAGQKSGDLCHPLPFTPELHFSDLKSEIADMKNSNLFGMDGPPSAIAGLFVGAHIDFAASVDWLHIDMAGLVTSSERATGYGVSLICALLAKHTNVKVAQQ